ncbi:MAG: hypothetical protein WAT19_11095 [Ferruginibacter sp.]
MKAILVLAAILTFSFAGISSEAKSTTALNAAYPPPPVGISFTFVRGHRQGNTVAVMWGVNNSRGIQYYKVYSTYQDPYDPYSEWELKGTVQPKNPHLTKFTDRVNIYPGYVNYKIVAVTKDGEIESPLCSILVSLNL